ncbi:Phytochrome-like protein cph1 [Burkholderiales bacterium]|nr:Phytochrome-like protein cph1 [Burkholderiales bacterium]
MASLTPGEAGDRRRKRLSRELRFLGLVACSYAVDAALLALFAAAGTVPLDLPIGFASAAFFVNLLFLVLFLSGYNERFGDHYLTAWQMAAATIIVLACLYQYPGFAFFFFNILIITFLFGNLRLARGTSVAAILLASAATGVVLSHTKGRLGMPPAATNAETILVWLSYTLTLARAVSVSYYGSMLRLQVIRQLDEHGRQMRQAYAEQEAFAYSVAHDLRAPLRGINGFSTVLEEQHGHRLDETARSYLKRIRDASARMGNIIDDLANLTQINRAILRKQKVDMSALAQEVMRQLADAEPTREVEFMVAPDLVVSADPGLMRIALENLFANARKFTSKKERARIEFGSTQSEGRIAYFVRDNGIGFDPSFSHMLFRQFQRLHADDEYEGTGIGLSIVERIVKRHGGEIWAEGCLGEGATFFFVIGE